MFLINMTSKLIINSRYISSEEKNIKQTVRRDSRDDFQIKTFNHCPAVSSGVCNGK